ncbi:MAG: 8-oxo-dGTP diphosphatase [Candidatus Aenigmatarchaeota archaeon]
MRDATLCFLVKENQILLGMKKRGFGEGKFNGFGGKVGENETIEEAAVRELLEETSVKVDPSDLKKMAEITFYFPFAPKEKKWDQKVHVFFIDRWEGEPKESEEMSTVWTDTDKLPFEKMWKDDKHWIPVVLQNKRLRATFRFDRDNESIMDYMMDEVDVF